MQIKKKKPNHIKFKLTPTMGFFSLHRMLEIMKQTIDIAKNIDKYCDTVNVPKDNQ